VVYKINCLDYKYSYVGQIKRKLTRLKEHTNDFKKTNEYFVISRHKLDHNHTIDWNNTIILDSEQFYYKRMVSEMIHIKRQELDLNKQRDRTFLKSIYQSLKKALYSLIE